MPQVSVRASPPPATFAQPETIHIFVMWFEPHWYSLGGILYSIPPRYSTGVGGTRSLRSVPPRYTMPRHGVPGDTRCLGIEYPPNGGTPCLGTVYRGVHGA